MGDRYVERQEHQGAARARLVSASANETRRIGRCLGRLLQERDLVLLLGPFGAGKTTLTQGIAKGLGIQETVSSPSFTLINEYEFRGEKGAKLYHVDLYRIGGPGEALDLGLDEYLDHDAITVIEWPEQARAVLPPERLEIALAFLGEKGRAMEVTAHGTRAAHVLKQFARLCVPPTLGEGT